MRKTDVVNPNPGVPTLPAHTYTPHSHVSVITTQFETNSGNRHHRINTPLARSNENNHLPPLHTNTPTSQLLSNNNTTDVLVRLMQYLLQMSTIVSSYSRNRIASVESLISFVESLIDFYRVGWQFWEVQLHFYKVGPSCTQSRCLRRFYINNILICE